MSVFSGVNRCLILGLLLSATSYLGAANQSVDLVFEVQEGSSSDVGAKITGGLAGEDSVDYSGTILARVVYDDVTLQLKTIEFRGGRVVASDTHIPFSGNVTIIGYGQFYMYFNIWSKDLAATYLSESGPSAVASDGSFDTSDPTVRLNDGHGIMSISIPSIPGYGTETEDTNFALNPESDPLGGTANLSMTVEPVSSLQRELVFTLTMTPDPEEVVHLDDTNSDITLTEVGTITSRASLVISTEFGRWATSEGLSLATGDEENSHGMPYRLLHAFNLNAEASLMPIGISHNNSGHSVVSIELPAAGLNRGLKAEYRAALTEGEWLDLPLINVLSGADSLDAGESGLVQLSFPSGDQGYIRLSLSE